MMWSEVGKKILGQLPGLFVCCMIFLAYIMGFSSGINKQRSEIDKVRLEHSDAKNKANELLAQELAESKNLLLAEQKKATLIGQELATSKQIIQQKAAEQKKGIKDAIIEDKAGNQCIDGFGINGLQQYKQALGYAHQSH